MDYIERRQTLRLQRCRIQIHLHLALFTAIGIGHRCARHSDELCPNKIQAIVVELLLRQVLTRESQLEDGDTRRAVGENERRRRPRRQLLELSLRNRRNLCNALLNVRGWLQKHFYNSNSRLRLRFGWLY